MEDTVRRIVTQLDPGGKSVFLSDGLPATIAKFSGGFVLAELWTLDAPPTDPAEGREPTTFALEPPPGGITYRLATIPPDTEVFAQLDTLRAEFGENPPISLDPDEFGMHQTQTIDFVTILSGEVSLRLDDAEVHLKAGDCVVQRGTRHAWRNRSAEPCVLSCVLVSTQRP